VNAMVDTMTGATTPELAEAGPAENDGGGPPAAAF
jgi:hypothetical protein